jgi:oxygen-independent coproporphyrinogen III oxidase
MSDLYKKYDVNVPRYTSYPTIVDWNNCANEQKWMNHVKDSEQLDLYIHIPFCNKLCWYCACNREVTKDQKKIDKYTSYLLKEIDQYSIKDHKIGNIHFGGGTPNALSVQNFHNILNSFNKKDFSISVEIDPRVISEQKIEAYSLYNVKHLSFGIQDFDIDVQNAINRYQPFELVQNIYNQEREKIDCDINFDLVYGLPKQNLESIQYTLDKVQELSPDTIALYSYAHMPKIFSAQKLINEQELLVGKDKRHLYDMAKKRLLEIGYVEIGLDHFVKKETKLYEAFKTNQLKRSFMGYTHLKSDTLVGIGVSSISESKNFYFQNTKDIDSYYKRLNNHESLFVKNHEMSEDDITRKFFINDLMCNLSVKQNRALALDDNKKIDEFISDKILENDEDNFIVKESGKPFLRNIASVFDRYRANTPEGFSRI